VNYTKIFAALLGSVAFFALAPSAYAADSPPSDTSQLEEVQVTAQRTTQNILDVPISVSVISAEKLQSSNYSGLTDLQYLVPGVTYNDDFGGGFEIRGVGTQSVNVSVEQSVSVVVDDVVQALPQISFAGPSYQGLTDISRIEVLKGPQGTLFGKNSSAGVIQVVTDRPDLDAFSADASVSYGSDNEIKLSGDANMPINDKMAFRISAFDYSRNGFVDNLYTGQEISGYDEYGVRGKFLWEPTPQLDIYLIAAYTKNHDSGNGIWTLRSCGSGFKTPLGIFSPCAEAAKYGIVASPTNLAGDWDGPNYVREPEASTSAHIDYHLGSATLSSITAYDQINLREGVEVDSSDLPVLSQNETLMQESSISQEFRIAGTADFAGILNKLDYTGGLFYLNTHINYYGIQAGTYNYLPNNSPIILTSGVGGLVPCCADLITTTTDSYAAYGQFTAHLFDNLAFTGGLRYTNDKNTTGVQAEPQNIEGLLPEGITVCQFGYAFGAPCLPQPLPSPVVSKSISANNLSGKATLQYYITPEMNFYATYATGYKGPSVSYPRGFPLVDVLPETSRDYEFGFKGEMLDNRLLLNADVFETNYSNFQGQALYIDPSNPADRSYVTTNAGGLQTKGAELGATFRATPEFTVDGEYSYTPTRFTQFAIPCENGYTNSATPNCSYLAPGAPAGAYQFNAAGYPLPYAPKNTFALTADYAKVFGDYLFHASANYHWQDSSYTVVADPNTIIPSYGILGASLSLGSADGRWDITVFARNLLNQYFVAGIIKTPLDTGSAFSTPLSTIGYSNLPAIDATRTVGIKLDVKFN